MALRLVSLVAATTLLAAAAMAASGPSGHHHGAAPSAVGVPAPRGQGRPMPVQMTEYAYSVKTVTVKVGDTIRFVVANKGSLLHEFNLNTAADHAEHRPMMTMMMEHGMITPEKVVTLTMTMPDGQKMTHTEPNSILLEPGKTGEIAWRFTVAGEFEIACNIPGHYESGMVTKVTVLPR